mgnify:CR=1 FL=1
MVVNLIIHEGERGRVGHFIHSPLGLAVAVSGGGTTTSAAGGGWLDENTRR